MINDGITITDRYQGKDCGLGKRYRIRVRDPQTQKYESKNFTDKDAGWRWARQRVAQFRAGLDVATRVSFAYWGEQYLERLQTRKRTERHIRQCEVAIQRLLAEGIDDMRDEKFARIVELTIAKLTKAQKGGLRAAALTPSRGVRGKPPESSNKPASTATKNFHLTVAKAVCKLAQKNRAIPFDPLAPVDSFSGPTELRRIFSVIELRALLNERHQADDWFLYVSLLAYTGARSSEAIGLTWDTIRWEDEIIELPSDIKGNKLKAARLIPIQPELLPILQARAKVGREHLVGSRLAKLPAGSVSRGFSDYCRRVGVDAKGRGPHCLRHTFCALQTALNVSPFQIMSMVGHSTSSTTFHYSSRALELRKQVDGWPNGEFFFRRQPPQGNRRSVVAPWKVGGNSNSNTAREAN